MIPLTCSLPDSISILFTIAAFQLGTLLIFPFKSINVFHPADSGVPRDGRDSAACHRRDRYPHPPFLT